MLNKFYTFIFIYCNIIFVLYIYIILLYFYFSCVTADVLVYSSVTKKKHFINIKCNYLGEVPFCVSTRAGEIQKEQRFLLVVIINGFCGSQL